MSQAPQRRNCVYILHVTSSNAYSSRFGGPRYGLDVMLQVLLVRLSALQGGVCCNLHVIARDLVVGVLATNGTGIYLYFDVLVYCLHS